MGCGGGGIIGPSFAGATEGRRGGAIGAGGAAGLGSVFSNISSTPLEILFLTGSTGRFDGVCGSNI